MAEALSRGEDALANESRGRMTAARLDLRSNPQAGRDGAVVVTARGLVGARVYGTTLRRSVSARVVRHAAPWDEASVDHDAGHVVRADRARLRTTAGRADWSKHRALVAGVAASRSPREHHRCHERDGNRYAPHERTVAPLPAVLLAARVRGTTVRRGIGAGVRSRIACAEPTHEPHWTDSVEPPLHLSTETFELWNDLKTPPWKRASTVPWPKTACLTGCGRATVCPRRASR